MSGSPRPSLSVVLLARDQAWNVDRLVGSVLAATDGLPREVVLVDSASADGTAELAERHPVGVLRIAAGYGARLTPAAGRAAGVRHTTGDLVLFLDGDMELQPGWLVPALAALSADASVVAVTGEVIDLPPGAPAPRPPAEAPPGARDVARAGGAALYRREALLAAGGFDPWLHAEEEPDLCRRGLLLGSGQIARRSRGRELPGMLRDRPFIATEVAMNGRSRSIPGSSLPRLRRAI